MDRRQVHLRVDEDVLAGTRQEMLRQRANQNDMMNTLLREALEGRRALRDYAAWTRYQAAEQARYASGTELVYGEGELV